MKIILPDFFLQAQGMPTPSLAKLALPALTTVLRGKTTSITAGTFWQSLNHATWPGMAVATLPHDIPDPLPGFWLRADPVLLRPTLDNLILFPGNHLAITQAEAEALVSTLNHLFAEDGLTFYAPTSERWYVHCQHVPAATFTELQYVLGRQIDGFLPTGKHALLWHRYLNEIQMLFYTHPVNEARSLAKQQMISSLWFWGGGYYPWPPQPVQPYTIYSDAQEICWQAQALAYPTCLFSGDTLPIAYEQSVWIISALSKALVETGVEGWEAALQYIDCHYLSVALQALKNQQIAQIELIFPEDTQAYQITTRRWDCWKGWRAHPQAWLEKIIR